MPYSKTAEYGRGIIIHLLKSLTTQRVHGNDVSLDRDQGFQRALIEDSPRNKSMINWEDQNFHKISYPAMFYSRGSSEGPRCFFLV